MRMRRSVVAAVAVAVGILGPATGAAAATAHQAGVKQLATVQASPKPSKPKKPKKAVFEGRGSISAIDVDAATVTVVVKGGTKNVRHRTVTVSVSPTARIKRNGAKASLASLAVGDRIEMKGTRAGEVYTVSRIQAQAKRTPKPAPTPEHTETETD
ncbi:hypothetical protein [Krasilnikovia sp. M28-CT-15]|uniref:hypothetical protein n=1 Tax=Krasilnikovia sp. M28-CT-15 TaxID=3373540 RepID=UPI003876D733